MELVVEEWNSMQWVARSIRDARAAAEYPPREKPAYVTLLRGGQTVALSVAF